MTKKAMRIAYHYHHGQPDINDIPYIFHPIHLAEQMEDELTTTVALFHDLVEDTACTEAERTAILQRLGGGRWQIFGAHGGAKEYAVTVEV